jgi:hypothetical protein
MPASDRICGAFWGKRNLAQVLEHLFGEVGVALEVCWVHGLKSAQVVRGG